MGAAATTSAPTMPSPHSTLEILEDYQDHNSSDILNATNITSYDKKYKEGNEKEEENRPDGIHRKATRVKKKMKQSWKLKTDELREKLYKNKTNANNASIRSEWLRRKQLFLDRIAILSEALLKSDNANLETLPSSDETDYDDHDEITTQSDLTIPNRCMCVVTTAALPWMTGTAVNPLLRAAYLWRKTNQLRDSIAKKYTDDNTHTKQLITLLIPWLELEEDRLELYGQDIIFRTESEQEEYIRTWMREKADLEDAADPDMGIKIIFYRARYHTGLRSIFAMGDMCSYIPDSDADVCILEEPEHLNWYRAPGSGWTTKFNYVVGVVHTNYKEYASGHYSGLWTSPAIGFLSSAMVRAYCHKVIKLSDVLQTYAPEKEVTSNVHGVRSEFLEEGKRRGQRYLSKANKTSSVVDSGVDNESDERVYFIGKILWAKGLDRLLDMESFYRQCTGKYFAIDVYGSGPEEKEIRRAFHGRKISSFLSLQDAFSNGSTSTTSIATMEEENGKDSETESDISDSDDGEEYEIAQKWSKKFKISNLSNSIKQKTDSIELDLPKSLHELRKHPIPSSFPGRIDHSLLRDQYKIFVNPSVSEVLCTTTAEALAMGKFVIIPVHPSNEFFLKFPNCLAYRNKMEFAANLRWAMYHEPDPLSDELAYEFTWEAATERFIESAAITKFEARNRSKLGTRKIDERIAWFHNELGKGVKGDVIRKVLGAGPVSDQVKYVMEKKEEEEQLGRLGDGLGGEEEDEEEEEEDEDEGLTRKFRASSFAQAIRSSLLKSLSSMKD